MEIIKEILKDIPERKVHAVLFEGANIVIYTKDRDFFLNGADEVRAVVKKIKKRIELRPDPSMCIAEELAREKIMTILGEEAGVDQIIFDPMRSIVNIEVEKPGMVIGKGGETVQLIKSETHWVPEIKRKPSIRSELIENVRSVLYANNDYRRQFLHKVGERIYNGWTRSKKDEWVRITYLGAARQVGRSCLLLQTPESKIMMDCGIDVADDKNPYPYLEAPEFNIKELDAVIISHAHMDHAGFVPYLFKYGYRGPVYCTAPTRDVSALLQLDLVKIQRYNGQDPIYTSEEIKELVKHTIILDYEEVTDITPDLRITFYNAGHILGSAMVHVNVGNGLHNLLYTGDQKFGKTNLLAPAHARFNRLETLMIESTYAGKNQPTAPYEQRENDFRNIIIDTVGRGGKVLMPVLGSGRAQEVMVIVERLIREGRIPDVPVYVDGMVWDITAIHTAYPEFLNSTIRSQIFQRESNPFLTPNLKRVGSAKERKLVIEEEGACVILATSGMLVGGPSVEYLKALATSKKHSLVFSCYQGPGSLGRRIQQGEKEIRNMAGNRTETIPINMEVHKFEVTGHSDRRELLNFVSRVSPRPKRVIMNHGDQSSCLDFASTVYKTQRIETLVPHNLDTLRLR